MAQAEQTMSCGSICIFLLVIVCCQCQNDTQVEESCGYCLRGAGCDNETGCVDGCMRGYTGAFCNDEHFWDTFEGGITLASACFGFLILVMIVVFVAVLCSKERRRKHSLQIMNKLQQKLGDPAQLTNSSRLMTEPDFDEPEPKEQPFVPRRDVPRQEPIGSDDCSVTVLDVVPKATSETQSSSSTRAYYNTAGKRMMSDNCGFTALDVVPKPAPECHSSSSTRPYYNTPGPERPRMNDYFSVPSLEVVPRVASPERNTLSTASTTSGNYVIPIASPKSQDETGLEDIFDYEERSEPGRSATPISELYINCKGFKKTAKSQL